MHQADMMEQVVVMRRVLVLLFCHQCEISFEGKSFAWKKKLFGRKTPRIGTEDNFLCEICVEIRGCDEGGRYRELVFGKVGKFSLKIN